jgi:hypothetical protein
VMITWIGNNFSKFFARKIRFWKFSMKNFHKRRVRMVRTMIRIRFTWIVFFEICLRILYILLLTSDSRIDIIFKVKSIRTEILSSNWIRLGSLKPLRLASWIILS